MRQYIDQIDDEIIKLKFTSEELENYKQLAKEFWVLKETISKLETDAKNRLQAVVIGDLTGVKFNYLSWGNSFFMSYVTPKRTKKWYQFWK